MTMQDTAQRQLRNFVERVERLTDERKALGDDIRDVFVEAKGQGFDVKIMKRVIAIRKKPKAERDEEESVLDVYLQALGMTGTPLADWADRVEEIGRAHGMPKEVIEAVQAEGV